jgi:hypothetical protein
LAISSARARAAASRLSRCQMATTSSLHGREGPELARRDRVDPQEEIVARTGLDQPGITPLYRIAEGAHRLGSLVEHGQRRALAVAALRIDRVDGRHRDPGRARCLLDRLAFVDDLLDPRRETIGELAGRATDEIIRDAIAHLLEGRLLARIDLGDARDEGAEAGGQGL